MPLVINTNITALNAQRQLVQSGNELNQAMERLSSGKRINTAADDAAGLAISNRMTSQVRGLSQAIRNANDGVSLIQTAEGALDETTNILQRIRELAIQASNGIYSDADRSTLDAEVQQLKAEVDRIAKSTTFNGQKLLDGSLGNVDLQVGAESGQTIALDIPGFTAASLGGTTGDIIGEPTVGGLTALNQFVAGGDPAHTLYINETAISDLSDGTTLNDKLAIMNADLDGKGASVSTIVNMAATQAGSGLLAGGSFVRLTLTDGDGNIQTYNIADTRNMEELAAKINSDTAIEAKIGTDGELQLTAAGATSLAILDASGATGIPTGTTANFALVITDESSDSRGVNVRTGASNDADVLALGINVHDANGNLQATEVGTTTATIEEGDLIINGVEIPAFTGTNVPATTATAAIEAINKVSDQTGVVAFLTANSTTQISLRAAEGGEIAIQYGTGASSVNVLAATGLQERNATSGVGSVAGLRVDTAAGAQRAIQVVDVALEQINDTRSKLGAVNNRLEFTMSNLANVVENTSSARSRIVDADFAKETAELSRAQVLQQASQAMLAQANAQPQQVLQLLQG